MSYARAVLGFCLFGSTLLTANVAIAATTRSTGYSGLALSSAAASTSPDTSPPQTANVIGTAPVRATRAARVTELAFHIAQWDINRKCIADKNLLRIEEIIIAGNAEVLGIKLSPIPDANSRDSSKARLAWEQAISQHVTSDGILSILYDLGIHAGSIQGDVGCVAYKKTLAGFAIVPADGDKVRTFHAPSVKSALSAIGAPPELQLEFNVLVSRLDPAFTAPNVWFDVARDLDKWFKAFLDYLKSRAE